MTLYDKIQETATNISNATNCKPIVGIILGSGLGGLIDLVEKEFELPYHEIPNFPTSTVAGHEGKLVFGKLGGKDVVLMAGRFHYYEGYTMQEITFPVRVMKALGVNTVIISNAAGGTNPEYNVGDLMIINDHINLFPEHPLRGANDERLGVRFPDMSEPYDLVLIEKALEVAADQNIELHVGVYAGLQGPTFETKAEYEWLNTIKADAVGMSTVPEAIVAVHGGMKVFATSVITDMGVGEYAGKVSHEEVLQAASLAAPKLAKLVAGLVTQM